MTQLGDDLKAARALVANGWCKGHFTDYNDSVCARAAVQEATTGWAVCASVRGQAAMACLEAHITSDFDLGNRAESVFMVARYNDDPNTTQQDILTLFDKSLADIGEL